MKRFIVSVFLVIAGLWGRGQVTETLYLDANHMPTSKNLAEYKIITSVQDSITTIRMFDLNENTECVQHYKNNWPVGKWQELSKGVVKSVYDFDHMNYLATEKLDRPLDRIFTSSFDSAGFVRPLFVGGEKARKKFLTANLQYPYYSQKHGVEGTVLVSFIVTREGDIKRPRIVESLSPHLDYEAVRIITSMPKWNPGTLNGEPVDVICKMPIVFTLTN